ncbi:hypothetical protein FDP41_000934 [Naegleria fowleri]|uniref:Eukaryotic translation initiation factor 5A n=1 Tax=Naegleria fowleri TaxID=5763 RepID=A0A6A5BZ19_NAEFO|nr:uncharacterized protein FDP41_000934 [Naegleria fowleri]KAF0979781.1 hypothetical protein FDP41_000934 [Naegleria fowleri]CAG4708257.1 unnamed protein product [Naegleria fowleri]
MSHTHPVQVGTLKKGGYVVIQGRACKIDDFSTSKPGKHGSAKMHLVGIDLFTGKKYEVVAPTSANIDAPYVAKKEYPLMDVSEDGYLTVLTDTGDERCDIQVQNSELLNRIKSAFGEDQEVRIMTISAMGMEQVVDMKVE